MRAQELLRLTARGVLVLCFGCTSHGQLAPSGRGVPVQTSVCQLVANCKEFNDRIVQFRASVNSDWFEHTALVEQACHLGIVPKTTDATDKRPGVDAFNRALERGRPGRTDLTITATFVGHYVCQPASKSSGNQRIIEIEDVRDLKVTNAESNQ